MPSVPLFATVKNHFREDHGIYHNLQRGTAILKSEQELNQYLFSYGNMHHEKMDAALEYLFEVISEEECQHLNVVDYACGQGLASLVFLNTLEAHFKNSSTVSKLLLIEPSKVALQRAESLLTELEPVLVNGQFDDVPVSDLITEDEAVKVHLFSNILDMGDVHFDLKGLFNKVVEANSGTNYFVCVSPVNKHKLDAFQSYFEHSSVVKSVDTLVNIKGYFEPSGYHVKLNVFKVEL